MTTPIINNLIRPVILLDDRDPEKSWARHVRLAGAIGGGGVDLAYGYRTRVKSMSEGTLQRVEGDEAQGWFARIVLPDHPIISYIQYQHLDDIWGATGYHVYAGQEIGLSGRSGYGSKTYYDPHLHVHAVDHAGNRVNVFHYFTHTVTSGGDVTPINPETPSTPEGGEQMYLTKDNTGTYFLVMGGKVFTIGSQAEADVCFRIINNPLGVTSLTRPEVETLAVIFKRQFIYPPA